MLTRLLTALLVLALAGCAAARDDSAASARAGCEVTGGDWNSASGTCDKR